jgi:predicted AAA+ superfamily ATPase
MEIIEKEDLPKTNLQPRSIELPSNGNIYLQGVSQSGKSSLVLDSLKEREFLYIDLSSEREISLLPKTLKKYSKFETLVLEIYNFSIEPLLPLIPKDKRTILISWERREVENFQNMTLYPLSFEEFLSFKSGSESLEHSFVRYSQIGGFPIFAKYSDLFLFKQVKRLLYFALSEFEIDILRDIADHTGVSRSRLNIYSSLKGIRKISKDKFYSIFSKMVENGYIIQLSERENSINGKYYLIDPALKNSFSSRMEFTRLFENMVVSELIKNGYRGEYFRNIDFFVEELSTAFLSLPFIDSEEIEKYLSRNYRTLKKFQLRRVVVITMDFEKEFKFREIDIEAIKFVHWALSF